MKRNVYVRRQEISSNNEKTIVEGFCGIEEGTALVLNFAGDEKAIEVADSNEIAGLVEQLRAKLEKVAGNTVGAITIQLQPDTNEFQLSATGTEKPNTLRFSDAPKSKKPGISADGTIDLSTMDWDE